MDNIPLHTYTDKQTETVVWRRALSVIFNVIHYARVWRYTRLYDESNVARSCSRWYHNSKRSLVVVSMLVLRLKAAESFIESSQYTLRTQQCLILGSSICFLSISINLSLPVY